MNDVSSFSTKFKEKYIKRVLEIYVLGKKEALYDNISVLEHTTIKHFKDMSIDEVLYRESYKFFDLFDINKELLSNLIDRYTEGTYLNDKQCDMCHDLAKQLADMEFMLNSNATQATNCLEALGILQSFATYVLLNLAYRDKLKNEK